MGVKNYLIAGVSCAGKTTVCDELQRRGYHAIDGDEELAYSSVYSIERNHHRCHGAPRKRGGRHS